MSSGTVTYGSRTGTTLNTNVDQRHQLGQRHYHQHQLQTEFGTSLNTTATTLCPSHWRNVHSARSDKITGQCLWNACKALTFGVVLLLIGAAMATIGYYSDSLSLLEDEKRGNVTIKVRNVSKQLHTLSYVGPIIMGVGGFVIVAACVMTFEARDSAAKIVPARFRNKINQTRIDGDEFTTGGQELCLLAAAAAAVNGSTSAGATHLQLVTTALGTSWEHRVHRLSIDEVDRLALTTAFVEFSQNIQKSIDSERERHQQINGLYFKQRCPSAPDLMPDQLTADCDFHSNIPKVFGVHILTAVKQLQDSSTVKRLQQVRQAISVDNPSEVHHFGGGEQTQTESSTDAGTMDLHLPDCSNVTLTVKDESKRSGEATSSASSSGSDFSQSQSSSSATSPRIGSRVSDVGRKESAKRHPLLRQRPVERHPDSDTEEEGDDQDTTGNTTGQAS